MSQSDRLKDIPEVVFDSENGKRYRRGKFYGKGGFAKCYEMIDDAGNILAGKIVSKKLLQKSSQREKMTQEIAIHKDLSHKNVVGFFNFFEDPQNVYILLELCRKRSMMELHKRRKILTEHETRYYMNQILNGVHYLHGNRIIHRDLKLGNLFLNDSLVVKIGDFGLAAKIEFDGERKKTLCGTPNYIAPEILTKNGHSYEVDIWSIGCIMYTLLVGTPPFETKSLKETYLKIKRCDYLRPSQTIVSKNAIIMIERMLQQDPKKRPLVKALIEFDFMKSGYLPPSLPVSSLTTAPRFDQIEILRNPLAEVNAARTVSNNTVDLCTSVQMNTKNEVDELLKMLINQLTDLLYKKKLTTNEEMGVETSDPEAHPVVWISKWVDYTDKYGFGYQLSDDCVGVMFNDNTKLVLLSNGVNVHYIENGVENYMTTVNHPFQLHKKMKLLTFFLRYMRDNLLKTGSNIEPRESDSLARTPYLHHWCRTTCAVVFHLTNGLVQVNFSDHNKIILCPLMQAVTVIDSQQSFITFRFSTIEKLGCSKNLAKYLLYALEKIKKFE